MEGLTVITPTGARPTAFALAERWMSRQTYRGPLQWVVIDDCLPRTRCTMEQQVILPNWTWGPGQNTQAANLLLGLRAARYDKVIIIEDDDWYGPAYLDVMGARLDEADIVGEMNARYYNAATRIYHISPNIAHSSLCQTGLRATALPILMYACQSGRRWLDIDLWKGSAGADLNRRMYPPQVPPLSIGIKGLPGRPGIGIGHRMRSSPVFLTDHNLEVLRSWIGEDAGEYARFGNQAGA